jgi:hypothetical protein
MKTGARFPLVLSLLVLLIIPVPAGAEAPTPYDPEPYEAVFAAPPQSSRPWPCLREYEDVRWYLQHWYGRDVTGPCYETRSVPGYELSGQVTANGFFMPFRRYYVFVENRTDGERMWYYYPYGFRRRESERLDRDFTESKSRTTAFYELPVTGCALHALNYPVWECFSANGEPLFALRASMAVRTNTEWGDILLIKTADGSVFVPGSYYADWWKLTDGQHVWKVTMPRRGWWGNDYLMAWYPPTRSDPAKVDVVRMCEHDASPVTCPYLLINDFGTAGGVPSYVRRARVIKGVHVAAVWRLPPHIKALILEDTLPIIDQGCQGRPGCIGVETLEGWKS